jgi:hypothetical protein
MRIWSIHPKYLDAKGVVALWRETLLAKHVLEDRTKGYKNHPQLNRFKECAQPLHAINFYLSVVCEEAETRGYQFDKSKIDWNFDSCKINVTKGQVEYEIQHLKNKLLQRDPVKLKEVTSIKRIETHPLFKVVKGDIETWEIIS